MKRTAFAPKRRAVTAEERAARAVVSQRSRGVCERCGQASATNWHHRKNQGQGGAWCPTNGLHLCGSETTGCHGNITGHPALARAHGWSVLSGQDPTFIPVLLAGVGWVLLRADGDFEPVEVAA